MIILLRCPKGFSGICGLVGLAASVFFLAPADAQQVTAAQGAVTIDVGVLNQLGPPLTPGANPYGQYWTYPQSIYGPPAYGQQLYGQPAYYPYAYPAQAYGGLYFPPQQFPVSSLTVPAPANAAPYVPNQVSSGAPAPALASAPPPAPAPAPEPAPAAPATGGNATASTEMTPPPPATPPTPTLETAVPAATPTTTAGTEATSTGQTMETTAPAATAGTTTTQTNGPTATVTTTNTASATSTQPTTTEATTAATGTTAGATAATTGGEAATTAGATTPAPAPSSAGGQTQTASVPPATMTEGQIRIVFATDSAEIPDAVKAELDALAQKMAADENMRIQLLAYASGTPETASHARRMSLSRALAVRSYLIKAGVRSTRMDVRALGNNVQGDPADRVDVIPKAQ